MQQDEFSPLPREPRQLPPEQTPPGPEFAEHAPRFPERKRKKALPLIAAALLLAVLVLPETAPAPMEMASVPVQTIPTQPLPIEPQPTQTQPPETAPTETLPPETLPPETVPSGPPECQPIFFAFSDALRARLVFTHADAIRSVRAELWDSLGQTLEQTWEVPLEAIAQGEYTLPDMPGMYDMYMAHHDAYDPANPFPVPELRVIMTWLDGETETTTELTQSYTEEQGWSVRTVEGELRFRTYEAYAPITLYAGDDTWDPETLESGALLVVVRMNGQTVPAEQCTVDREEQSWFAADGEGITLHYAALTTPCRGESGEAAVTVYQKLQGYDTVWSETVIVPY